ncbi:MAG TPA: M1 family aminopeptidase [Bacteroidales bacterium]|nr:M1 family aminopeptidase [Bacteroidales bacterium]
MKKISLIILITGFVFSGFYAQSQRYEKGAQYCSHRKSMMKNTPANVRSENSPRHRFDVLNYKLNMDLWDNFQNPFSQAFDATETVTFRVDTALNQIKLDAVNTSLTIHAVGLAGIGYTHFDDTLTVQLDRIYNPGEIAEVSIDYSHKNVEDEAFYVSGGFVFTDCETEGARKWFPCYDRPADKATVDITAKVPGNVLLGSNGRLADSVTVADTTWYRWISRDPVATYLVVVSASNNWDLDIVYWDRPSTPGEPMPIRFYYETGDNPVPMENIITDMATYFSDHYGEHPFEKDGFASVGQEFSWAGMENQTLTSICPGCWYESLICHEFAHQWFGDMISPGTWADIWLNEAFATWSEAFWYENDGGYQAYLNEIQGNASYYLATNPGWAVYEPEWAVETPDNTILFNYSITYMKSSCVLHLLRYALGDSLFFPAIMDYATDTAEFKYKNAITDDFQAKMEESTGEDLDWFFDSWVKQPNHPVYENIYSIHDNNNGTWNVNFQVNQVQDNAGFFPLPVEISVFFAKYTDTTLRVMNDVNNQSFTFTFDKEPGVVFFDLDNKIVLKQASLMVGTPEPEKAGKSLFLEQNFPNPVKNSTTLTYTIPESGAVELVIYSTTGNSIKVLVNEVQEKGTHQVTADLSYLPDGLYFCRLQASGQESVIKLAVNH